MCDPTFSESNCELGIPASQMYHISLDACTTAAGVASLHEEDNQNQCHMLSTTNYRNSFFGHLAMLKKSETRIPVIIQSPRPSYSGTHALNSSTARSSAALSTLVHVAIHCSIKEIRRKISARGDKAILLLKTKSFLLSHNIQHIAPNKIHTTCTPLHPPLKMKFSLKYQILFGTAPHPRLSLMIAHTNTAPGHQMNK
jgi:hypothetical protein